MKLSLRDLLAIPLLAAVVAALGVMPPIHVPIVPVPITAQTLGVMLAGNVLGSKRGFLSIFLFLILVAVGLPLLAGGRGGLAVFASPSAGFLWGWPFGAWLTGYLAERARPYAVWWLFLFDLLGGIGVVYAFGVLGLVLLGGMTVGHAWLVSLVFVPGDLIKAVGASLISPAIRRALQAASLDPLPSGRVA